MKQSCVITILIAIVLMAVGCELPQNPNIPQSNTQSKNMPAEDPFDPDRPPTAKTLYLMADILSAQGKDNEAEQLYRRILSEQPDFLPAYNELAALEMRQRRIPEAMKTLEAGLAFKSDDPVLLNNMGMCCLVRKKYERALSYFTDAAAIVPENTRYRSNMATVLALMGRRDEALALYLQILTVEEATENIQALYNSVGKDNK